jgi:hypothetical protein
MKNTDFLDYLKEYHADNEADGVMDDDLSDHFENWLVNLENQDLLTLADKAIVYYREQLLNELRTN